MDGRGSNGGDKGLIWQLPELHIENFGKVGPAFGAGVGCGLGLGLGLVGGLFLTSFQHPNTPLLAVCISL